MTRREKLLVNVRRFLIKELVDYPDIGYVRTTQKMMAVEKLNTRIVKFNPKLK